jgi:ParB family chromosome partitioning protein
MEQAKCVSDRNQIETQKPIILSVYPLALADVGQILAQADAAASAAASSTTFTISAISPPSTASISAGSAGPGLASGGMTPAIGHPSVNNPSSDPWIWAPQMPLFQSEESLTPLMPHELFQKQKVPLTISDGMSAMPLSAVIKGEFSNDLRTPRLQEFVSDVRALALQESANTQGLGDPAEYARLSEKIIADYPSVLAETRGELESPDSAWAKVMSPQRAKYMASIHTLLVPALDPLAEPGDAPTVPAPEAPVTLGTAMRMAISAITVPKSWPISTANVDGLVESMRDLGQLQPIVVTAGGDLIAGYHRLVAAQRLGWVEIDVVVFELEDTKRRLATLDENLMRRKLPALEHAEALQERKRLYESLHPETKQHRAGGVAKAAKSATEMISVAGSFATDTAARTGLSPRSVQLYTKVAGISTEVRDVLRSSSINDNLTELVSVSRLPPSEQKPVARALAKGDAKTVKEAVAVVHAARPSAASSMPFALTQGPGIRKVVADIRRLNSEIEATLETWKSTAPSEMAPLIKNYTALKKALKPACLVAESAQIPAAACACGGKKPNCSECRGRGWVAQQ